MIICDLCGEAKVCLPKEIDGREYDICSACWNVLTQKLQGKGRRIRETVSCRCRERPRNAKRSSRRCLVSRPRSGACPTHGIEADPRN